MTEIECGDCWRRDNLTRDQLLDPANEITGTIRRCIEHERAWVELHETFKSWEPYIIPRNKFGTRLPE